MSQTLINQQPAPPPGVRAPFDAATDDVEMWLTYLYHASLPIHDDDLLDSAFQHRQDWFLALLAERVGTAAVLRMASGKEDRAELYARGPRLKFQVPRSNDDGSLRYVTIPTPLASEQINRTLDWLDWRLQSVPLAPTDVSH